MSPAGLKQDTRARIRIFAQEPRERLRTRLPTTPSPLGDEETRGFLLAEPPAAAPFGGRPGPRFFAMRTWTTFSTAQRTRLALSARMRPTARQGELGEGENVQEAAQDHDLGLLQR